MVYTLLILVSSLSVVLRDTETNLNVKYSQCIADTILVTITTEVLYNRSTLSGDWVPDSKLHYCAT
jgi:hypothetical protein